MESEVASQNHHFRMLCIDRQDPEFHVQKVRPSDLFAINVHGYEMVFSMEGSSKLQQTVYVHKKSDIGRASLHAHHGLTFQKAISEEAFQQAPPRSNISSLTRCQLQLSSASMASCPSSVHVKRTKDRLLMA